MVKKEGALTLKRLGGQFDPPEFFQKERESETL